MPGDTPNAPILIAGGGIGGLTAAVVLRRAGFAVEVFERAPEIREVGAGIAIQPNAVLSLYHATLQKVLLQSLSSGGSTPVCAYHLGWIGQWESAAACRLRDRLVAWTPGAFHRLQMRRLFRFTSFTNSLPPFED